VCGIATINTGCRQRGKEQRHRREEASKTKGSGARNALKTPSLRYTRGLGWRMHCGAEVTESSTNKQHHLSRPAENGETSDAYMEYGLPPPRRIKQRRDRKMAEKQVYTMATAKEVAPGSDWHFSVRTADAEVWLQENSIVHTV
jgi:hypothetical protein